MKRMDLHKMFKWRIRVTKNRLGRWYIIIGVGLILLFLSACASDRGHYRNYYHEIKCHAENEIQYCMETNVHGGRLAWRPTGLFGRLARRPIVRIL